MTPPDPRAAFYLERRAYRRRRLGDAARLLPVVGTVLVLLPLLWVDRARLSSTFIYLFLSWAGLIGAAAFIAWLVGPAPEQDEPRPPGGLDDHP